MLIVLPTPNTFSIVVIWMDLVSLFLHSTGNFLYYLPADKVSNTLINNLQAYQFQDKYYDLLFLLLLIYLESQRCASSWSHLLEA